ncbi:MAG TPA: SIS domain-containing protein [Gaiellaceae bacterium]|jgi:glucosamine--fructose-6-phosphate aminotransferase (isomerizing)
MKGEHTRTAVFAQPDWLRQVPTDRRLPDAKVLFTGCGTSFHAAQTGGDAAQALDLVLQPRRDAAVLVAISHEGTTKLTTEAVEAWPGETWLITGAPESPLAKLCDQVVVAAPEIEKSWCHTASYTSAVAAIAALRGQDISELPELVEAELERPALASDHERFVVVGAGSAWPTAQEAVLKLREGAHLAAEAHHTEQLLHGHLAGIDETVRCFVLEGEGRASERARGALAALRELGCDVEFVPTRHPVVDIVRFQLLTLAMAQARGVDPDPIRTDDERWKRARAQYD